jgi:hypothetical protein
MRERMYRIVDVSIFFHHMYIRSKHLRGEARRRRRPQCE